MGTDKEWPSLSVEQMRVAQQFLDCIFGDDVDAYWGLISKVDKARLFGMYRARCDEDTEDFISFREYIADSIMPDHANNYEKLRDNNPGISTTLRYTEEGEALVYLLEDVKESKVFTKETKTLIFPLTLTVDAEYDKGEVTYQWKVRAYSDKLYEIL